MDEFDKNDFIDDREGINEFLELVESCDSEETRNALETSLLSEE